MTYPKEVLEEVCIFASQFGIKSVILDTDFWYQEDEDTLAIALVVPELGFDNFLNVVEKCDPLVNCDPFLWALMHEIGHSQTLSDFTEKERKRDQLLTKGIRLGVIPQKEYYVMPTELAATQWAVDYVNNHIEQLKTFWCDRLQPAILKFYEDNEIEDN